MIGFAVMWCVLATHVLPSRHMALRLPRRRKATMPPTAPGSEHDIQARFISIIRQVPHPAARATRAIPNGFLKTKTMRLRAWREGVLAGTWDIIVPIPVRGSPGLWMETKRPGGHLSPEQVEFRDLLLPFGWKFVVCETVEEMLDAWCAYLGLRINLS
jgi:hypothetical protein